MSEINHRMTRRLNGWDYCQRAIYSITLTLADRSRPWLGRLILAKNGEAQNNLAKNGEAQNNLAKNLARESAGSVAGCSRARFIALSPFGEAMVAALKEMPRFYAQVQIIEWQVMPDHFHFILFVTSPIPKPLGALIRGFKAGAAKRWKNLAENNLARERASFVAGHFCPVPRWSEGFQDTIILREGQLAAEIAYLHDNPRRLAEKRANPELFRRVANVALPLDGGRIIGRFEALGNINLLRRPLVQVQCSRRYFAYKRLPKKAGGVKIARDDKGEIIVERVSREYEAIKEDVFAAAQHGAVVISPCISDGERQIAREALDRGLRLVAMRNKGFAPLQKPAGRLFDICAEGRLLVLAPAAWPHSTQNKPMTRFDATALNRICQWFTGEDAAEINYHGMTPSNIDRLAKEAILAKSP